MKIKRIKINNFGKLEDKDIEFGQNINVIYGKNEVGKSTFLKCISGLLYGLSKNKNGELISDMDKYRPWNNKSFSGKIDYELDDGSKYGVYRDFNKKNPIIYNEFGEDISNIYKKDKVNGISFFEEQSHIDKELYQNTAFVEQEKTRLKSTTDIISRITNIVTTGDDVISYKDTISRIKSEQLERVGSERSSQKPINRLNSQINQLTKEKEKLEEFKNNYTNNETDRDAINQYLEVERRKIILLKAEKENIDKNRRLESEIDILKSNIKDLKKKSIELEGKVNAKGSQKRKTVKDMIVFLFAILTIVITWITINDIRIKSVITGIIILLTILILIKKILKAKEDNLIVYKQVINSRNDNSELDIVKENYLETSNRYDEKIAELDAKVEKQYNELIDRCISKEERDYVNSIFDMSEKELLEEIEKISNSIYEADVKLRLLNQDIENSNQRIEQLLQVEEQLQYLFSEKEKLNKLNTIYELTKKCLEEAYFDIKKSISPRYKDNLAAIINRISDGKYSRVDINDDAITVETEYGELVPINLLSTGTIDQIFLSLRLSIIKELTDEKLPVFFDETFAYFDDERLENILVYINENYKDRQICIFSCSRREIELLERMNMKYNLIEL